MAAIGVFRFLYSQMASVQASARLVGLEEKVHRKIFGEAVNVKHLSQV